MNAPAEAALAETAPSGIPGGDRARGAPGGRSRRRPKRPASDYLDLWEIETLLATAWRLVAETEPVYYERTRENALKTEVAVYTGLRIAELHALAPRDFLFTVDSDGNAVEKGLVRVGMAAKGAKPRLTTFLNGGPDSPTLAKVRALIQDRKRSMNDAAPLWRAREAAWHQFVTYRLGPASGLQREIPNLTGVAGKRLWRVHPHSTRACFVMIGRRLPSRLGRDPLSWETLCQLGGWDSVDTVRKHYYACDLPGALAEVAAAFGAGGAGSSAWLGF